MKAQPVVQGLVTGVVGFASSFTVVLAGLRAVGADQEQAASGLFALCLTMGVAAIVLSLRTRMPIACAWSTPGAALLISTGHVSGGYAAAVGAFLVCGVLLTLAGLSGALGRLTAKIPPPVASAMLAGIILQLCLAPVRAAVDVPELAGPVIVTWLVLFRFARLYAVPAALIVAVVAVLIDRPIHLGGNLLPHPVLTSPTFTAGALISIAIPLFIVTMASQNIPGMTVLGSFGYRPKLPPLLFGTGAGSVVGSLFGGHAINLAAITAVMAAGPDAGPDTTKRYQAAVSCGVLYLGIALSASVAVAFVAAAPPVLVEAVAGLALIVALGGALQNAMADAHYRDAATVTFVTCASGITAAGIGASFWGLVAGLAFVSFQRAGAPAPSPPAPGPASPPAVPVSPVARRG
ncbi:MAG: benzoate rane transport protein [Solirubrobacteraceae bacterium]|nr:benzoate rane transport protein [Solirubrobacteraceae bacterium]